MANMEPNSPAMRDQRLRRAWRRQARGLLTRPARWLFRQIGYDIIENGVDLAPSGAFPPDFDQEEIEDYLSVADYTLTGPIRTVSLIRASIASYNTALYTRICNGPRYRFWYRATF